MKTPKKERRLFRPQLEALEDRYVPSTVYTWAPIQSANVAEWTWTAIDGTNATNWLVGGVRVTKYPSAPGDIARFAGAQKAAALTVKDISIGELEIANWTDPSGGAGHLELNGHSLTITNSNYSTGRLDSGYVKQFPGSHFVIQGGSVNDTGFSFNTSGGVGGSLGTAKEVVSLAPPAGGSAQLFLDAASNDIYLFDDISITAGGYVDIKNCGTYNVNMTDDASITTNAGNPMGNPKGQLAFDNAANGGIKHINFTGHTNIGSITNNGFIDVYNDCAPAVSDLSITNGGIMQVDQYPGTGSAGAFLDKGNGPNFNGYSIVNNGTVQIFSGGILSSTNAYRQEAGETDVVVTSYTGSTGTGIIQSGNLRAYFRSGFIGFVNPTASLPGELEISKYNLTGGGLALITNVTVGNTSSGSQVRINMNGNLLVNNSLILVDDDIYFGGSLTWTVNANTVGGTPTRNQTSFNWIQWNSKNMDSYPGVNATFGDGHWNLNPGPTGYGFIAQVGGFPSYTSTIVSRSPQTTSTSVSSVANQSRRVFSNVVERQQQNCLTDLWQLNHKKRIDDLFSQLIVGY